MPYGGKLWDSPGMQLFFSGRSLSKATPDGWLIAAAMRQVLPGEV